MNSHNLEDVELHYITMDFPNCTQIWNGDVAHFTIGQYSTWLIDSNLPHAAGYRSFGGYLVGLF